MVRNNDGTGSLKIVQQLDYEDQLQSNGFRFRIQVNDKVGKWTLDTRWNKPLEFLITLYLFRGRIMITISITSPTPGWLLSYGTSMTINHNLRRRILKRQSPKMPSLEIISRHLRQLILIKGARVRSPIPLIVAPIERGNSTSMITEPYRFNGVLIARKLPGIRWILLSLFCFFCIFLFRLCLFIVSSADYLKTIL